MNLLGGGLLPWDAGYLGGGFNCTKLIKCWQYQFMVDPCTKLTSEATSLII